MNMLQEDARMIRKQNIWRRTERRGEITREERIQAREINAEQQKASRMRRAQ
jgi:hypothetical protein